MSIESPLKPDLRDAHAQDSRPLRFAVVIPAYNEARTLGLLLDQVLKKTQTVIVVNDASTDETAEIASKRAVILLNQSRNTGKGHALATGFRHALEIGCDFVITMDGDAQHDPADLPRFFDAARSFPKDVIVGARLLHRETAPWNRLIANRVADFWISWASGQPLCDSQCGFRCIPREVLMQINVPDEAGRGFVFESEFLIETCRHEHQVRFVPIRSLYPVNRRPSHFRPVADISRITLMVAWKLCSRGLFIRGLLRSLRTRPHVLEY